MFENTFNAAMCREMIYVNDGPHLISPHLMPRLAQCGGMVEKEEEEEEEKDHDHLI